MIKRYRSNRVAFWLAALALALTFGASLAAEEFWRESLREAGFDAVLRLDHAFREQPAAPIRTVVVDIDQRSIGAVGNWPWSRQQFANLLENIANAGPLVIGTDILFHGADTRSPAALARALAAFTQRTDLEQLATRLSDADQRLAQVVQQTPTVLGFVFGSRGTPVLSTTPVFMRGAPALQRMWRSEGVIGPHLPLAAVSAGLGGLILPGDLDGTVRRVPLLLLAGDTIYPGLALETVRASRRSAAYFIASDPLTIRIDDLSVPLASDGFLRLAPSDEHVIVAMTISAADVLSQDFDPARLAGSIVIVGSSAPQAGGLRPTAGDILTPSVQIQGHAVRQILSGRNPLPWGGALTELAIALGAGVLGLALGTMIAPVLGLVLCAGFLLSGWMSAVVLSLAYDRLIDPLSPSLFTSLIFAVGAITSASVSHRREARIRGRFEQHLAPSVVRRIVEHPHLLKLSGEIRTITALFTDVEGFTAMTRHSPPEKLIAVLDIYFEGITSIVIEHGGMVDKIVGDAVHAFFNAPFDLPDHPVKAVQCATAIRKWSGGHRQGAEPRSLGFGRTRIGVETGSAIVGDVGIRTKLDYTAHGDAVNMAARLEGVNKHLRSEICIGPEAASHCDPRSLRPLGRVRVSGRTDEVPVYEPWPETMAAVHRADYLAACNLMETSKPRAADMLERLAHEYPNDPAISAFVRRLRYRSDPPARRLNT
jgi:adenylate cyclase